MSCRFVPLVLFGIATTAVAARLPETRPENRGFDSSRLSKIDAIVEAVVAEKQVPGAVVVVGRENAIVYIKAFGQRSLVPALEPMTRDTIFDLASLTKPVATALSIMLLVERGKLKLDDRLGDLLPEFDNHGKGQITIEQLLRHRGGLMPDNPIADYHDGPESAWKRIAALDLSYQPGHGYVYSDVGFEILGRVVERISNQPLNKFTDANLFKPLGMSDTGFNPPNDQHLRIAPTERVDGTMLRGVVHDPRARALGGVAGHAGLFSTADDLAILANMIASFSSTIFKTPKDDFGNSSLQKMIDAGHTLPGQRRALGWDVDTPHSSPRGRAFGTSGIGHTGFTGTSLWIDMETHTFIIILTSRLHPDGKGHAPNALRSQVATAAAEAIVGSDAKPESAGPVRCGIDVLRIQNFAPLQGKRIGLVTNHTGRTREGVATIDVLHKAKGVTLAALFSPEHGIRGAVDAEVPDARDEATGLPIYSLYGKTRKPTTASLKDLDALVYDIQDIGTRFYTYISTLGLVLEAAKERGIPLFVLDRPNPIGGVDVEGPIREAKYESFIAFHALPVRHGMTVGELADMFNKERQIHAELHVIRCEGWNRRDRFNATGLFWVNPSPNMRSPVEAQLYPGIGLLEGTNLATGRGTDTPFERVGAPWIDPLRFARGLNEMNMPCVKFTPIRFTPKERQYAGEDCGGVFIELDSLVLKHHAEFSAVQLGLTMAGVLHSLYPREWKPEALKKFLCHDAAYQAVLDGMSYSDVQGTWKHELEEFVQRRQRFLLYP